MRNRYKEEGDLVQIHAGLSKTSQESPTQTGLPSRSNCALLCLKPRNAKNSCCDLTRVNNKKNSSSFLFWAPQWKAAKQFLSSFAVRGITASQVESNGLYPNLLLYIYVKWHKTKDTEAKLLLRGWSSLTLAVQGTLLQWPSFIRQA